MSTVVFVAATCEICSYAWRIGELVPTMLEKSYRCCSSDFRCVFSSSRFFRSSSITRCTFKACAIIEATTAKKRCADS